MEIKVGARDLKNRLGSYLRAVRDGTHVIVTERGIPVAELQAIVPAASVLDERLQQMALEGLVTLPIVTSLSLRRPRHIASVTLSDAIIEDR